MAEPGGASGGGPDDEVLVLTTEQAGTASRPLRVQAGQADPLKLKRWITSDTVSSSAWTSWAITGTRFPPAEASNNIARR
ncbi:hypothetical protein GCM10010524_65510 [Streptomyces mexicanus]